MHKWFEYLVKVKETYDLFTFFNIFSFLGEGGRGKRENGEF